MPDYYVSQGGGAIGAGTYRGLWTASQTYVSGDRVVPTRAYATKAAQFYVYECTTGGTAGGTEPTWVYTTPGTSTTTDSGVTWTCRACTTWANANIYLEYMAENDVAGDRFFVKNDLNTSFAGAISMSWAGTLTSPTRVLCVSDSNEPPTTLATGAVVATTGTNTITTTGSTTLSLYMYGITLKAGSGTAVSGIFMSTSSGGWVVYDNCTLEIGDTNGSTEIAIGGSGIVHVLNSTLKFAAAGQRLICGMSCVYQNCVITGALITDFCRNTAVSGSRGMFEACDFSACAQGLNIFSITALGVKLDVRNCKMPANWTGSIHNGTPPRHNVLTLSNSDSSDTNYRFERKTYFGTVTHNTSIYRTAGASDGTTALSYRMVSGGDTEWMHQTLDSQEIVVWNETTGSAITVTCEILIDSNTTLYKEDVWMEIQHLGTSGFPLGVLDTDSRLANYLTTLTTTECDAGTGVANWTGESVNAKSYKLVSTITPQEKGFIHAIVKLAKASTTIYICPKLVIA